MPREGDKPRPRWKRLLPKLAISGASLLACLLVLEVVLRLCGYGNLEVYEPDLALYWKLKPNQVCVTKVGRKPVRINSQGTRGAEFIVQKPSNTFRILSLGDSRTFGWGLAGDETYSAELGRLLQQASAAGKKVEVINAGVNAWSFQQMLIYFRDTGVKYQPDAVVIGEANLWTQFSEKNSPEFALKFMSRVRLKNFLRRFATYDFIIEGQLSRFYQNNRTKFIPVDPAQDPMFKEQQQKDPDAVFRAAITDICRQAQSNGIKPVLLVLPTVDELEPGHPGRVSRLKESIRAELNVSIVDVTTELAAKKSGYYLDADPVHLNAEGSKVVAQKLAAAMTNLVLR